MTLRTSISLIFYALVIVFFGFYLRDLEFAALAQLEVRWSLLALGIVLGVLQRMLFPLVWVVILRSMGAVVRDYAEYNFVYAKAWLGRYIPGKVAMIAARIYFAERLGASRAMIAVSTLLEIGVQLLVAAVVGVAAIASLGSVFDAIRQYAVATYLLIGVLAFLLLPPVFNVLLRLAYRILHRHDPGDPPHVRTATVAKGIVGFLGVSVAIGLYVNVMTAAVAPQLLEHYVFIWGMYSLAGALGMVFVFAPSGLGVREAIQLPLLCLLIPKETAVAIVVLIRLAETSVDLGFYGLSAAISRWRRR